MTSKDSRTKRTALNAFASLADNLIRLIIKFASRYVFIYTLGQQYLGVSALFSSIITMLSLADLGFGIALPQALYKPLAEKDEERICTILKFYSKVYAIISFVVITIGIALLPFLKWIIATKDTSGIEHLNIIYVLFIVQAAVSYLFIYKKTLFTADQKNYYVTVIESATSIVSTLCQIAILLLTRNYLLYLVISIVAIIIQNIFISRKCDKYYPFLKNIKTAKKLDSSETKILSKKIYALFIYKAAIAVESGTDNLVMTALCGLLLTGLCSNYTLIISSLTSILMMVMSAATASIGNVVVTESKENTFKIYSLLDFIGFWVYSVCGICMVVLINPFIQMWLGADYLIGISTVIVLCVNFYISGTQNVNSNFRNAYGLFYEGRYRPICMIVINLGSSIILAKYIGVTGIFIGTLLSRLLTVGTFDPFIVFKHGLKMPLRKYYSAHGVYHTVTIGVGALLFFLFDKWMTDSVVLWIIKAITLFVLVNCIYIILFFRNPSFVDLMERIRQIVKKVFHVECK
jgi:O-antigen/teichoic acid export membrane protein